MNEISKFLLRLIFFFKINFNLLAIDFAVVVEYCGNMGRINIFLYPLELYSTNLLSIDGLPYLIATSITKLDSIFFSNIFLSLPACKKELYKSGEPHSVQTFLYRAALFLGLTLKIIRYNKGNQKILGNLITSLSDKNSLR